MITAGIDIGSMTTKGAIVADGRILMTCVRFTGYNAEAAGEKVFRELLDALDLEASRVDRVVATGYGRKAAAFAQATVTEITCHAAGAHHLDPRVRSVIDIGGQDSKAIALNPQGKVRDFAMNDKCAAGTGRFFEAMSRIFRMDLNEFSSLSLKANKIIPVTAQCSVFAESEVISLLARRNPPEDIAAGIQMAVSKRCFTSLKRIGMRPHVTVTGGCAKSQGLIKALTRIIDMEVTPLPVDPQIIGALGAAVFASRRA